MTILLKFMSGYTLLELLFAIFIIAGILLFGVDRYKMYHQRADIAAVKTDEKIIMQALDHYFQQQGCDKEGKFNHNLMPSMEQLGLSTQYEQRLPLIERFLAVITPIGTTKDGKSVYKLAVEAFLNSKIVGEKKQWYLGALGAQELFGSYIEWTAMPGSSVTQLSNEFWLMNASRRAFKQFANSYNQTGDDNYSYCAG